MDRTQIDVSNASQARICNSFPAQEKENGRGIAAAFRVPYLADRSLYNLQFCFSSINAALALPPAWPYGPQNEETVRACSFQQLAIPDSGVWTLQAASIDGLAMFWKT